MQHSPECLAFVKYNNITYKYNNLSKFIRLRVILLENIAPAITEPEPSVLT